ncbi:hypothetical protein A4A49_35961 [Nicotiana attenuata]|uniref:VQ domain-containing protein n=1 Tax=Nicotiana attenuata TaxID=49451 RepID=A0A1J6KFJ8_NICAT|nr:hypothetical protein A4A49_35961 [Nicotiana attenuata]
MKPIFTSDTIPSCSKLTMHKDSHSISKLKPKIRIIHIIAPQIIKTDVENFRELVQRLTGKHAAEGKGSNKKRKELINPQRKIEEKNYRAENSSNGFWRRYGMDEGFIQNFGEFPVFPFKSTQINMFGETEMPLCYTNY